MPGMRGMAHSPQSTVKPDRSMEGEGATAGRRPLHVVVVPISSGSRLAGWQAGMRTSAVQFQFQFLTCNHVWSVWSGSYVVRGTLYIVLSRPG